jgi:hypothetical protein
VRGASRESGSLLERVEHERWTRNGWESGQPAADTRSPPSRAERDDRDQDWSKNELEEQEHRRFAICDLRFAICDL